MGSPESIGDNKVRDSKGFYAVLSHILMAMLK